MYAVVEIGGHQYKVASKQVLYVYNLGGNAGDKVVFDKVLLLSTDSGVQVGTPTVSGAAISATIQSQLKDDKVIVFKKKRRKGYKVKNGFRQSLTKIVVDGIATDGSVKSEAKATKKVAPKAEPVVANTEAPKKATKKADKGDDLTKIEGIGPKIAGLMVGAGIDSFAKLATADLDQLKAILEEAGSRYKMHDPTTWPQQADLAANGKWDELKVLQDELNGGRPE